MTDEIEERLKKLKHLQVHELKVGMYVADSGISWTNRPYLFVKTGLIESEDDIRQIINDGYIEAYIDPSHSVAYTDPQPLEQNPDIADSSPTPPLKPKVPLAEEIQNAAEVQSDTVVYVRSFMSDIRTGKLDMAPASGFMEKIMESVDRNVNAMMSLCRLRSVDSYTYMHCVNVSVFTSMFARYTGMNKQEVLCAGLAGLFHDLGKALVPTEILNAPRRLSPQERTVMNSHPSLGYEQVKNIPGVIPEVPLGMLHHHEKYDGTGYPSGLSGDAISGTGYMVALADIYDALTSKRVYKDGMSPHRALGVMYEMRGKDLHPEMLDRFIRMIGVYPVGSVVEMSDGSWGVVSAVNLDEPIKPSITLIRDAKGKVLPDILCDLASPDNKLKIARCAPAGTTGINPAQVLQLPPSAAGHA
ncbi:MAG: HD-GYP domain-containing protein [Desulfovibrio sp.]|nr:HD-GYP domain-containing protein [Desulfovibrio sp.]